MNRGDVPDDEWEARLRRMDEKRRAACLQVAQWCCRETALRAFRIERVMLDNTYDRVNVVDKHSVILAGKTEAWKAGEVA